MSVSGLFARKSSRPKRVTRENALDRLLAKVEKREDGCWIYGSGSVTTYAAFSMSRGETMPAHRASWLLHNGAIPTNLFVLHKCDRPRCVNPDHLFVGTHKDNMADMRQKGRDRPFDIRLKHHLHQLFPGEPVVGHMLMARVTLQNVRGVKVPEQLWKEITEFAGKWDPRAILVWLAARALDVAKEEQKKKAG